MGVRVLLLLSVFTATVGQILFKKGMSILGNQSIQIGIVSIFRTFIKVVFSPFVFTGLFFYGLSTILWLLALSKTELSYAYPFTLLTFILVMLSSFFIFSEAISLNRVLGAIIICIGVIVVSIK